jgi:predicted transcriptional regulator
MTDSPLPRPTNAELDILQVLWDRESGTVRDVCDALARARSGEAPGYTTVLKLMQIMTEKGLLARDEKERAHVYRPMLPRERAQRVMVSQLLERVFAGSALQLMMQALAARKTSPEEIRRLRELLDRHEKGIPEKGTPEE